MKNYSISQEKRPHPRGWDSDIVTITNRDENPIIKNMLFYTTLLNAGQIQFTLSLYFKKNTLSEETKKMLESLGGEHLRMLNIMTISSINDIQVIKNFFDYSQTIDSVPMKALHELKKLLPEFDLLNSEEIKNLVANGKHNEAIKLACQHYLEGDDSSLIYLVNLYQEREDSKNYHNVLCSIPLTHHSFIDANIKLLNFYLNNPPSYPNNSPDEKITYLEKLFRHSLNANLHD